MYLSIKPNIMYGGEALATAYSSVIDRLERIQNNCLRLVTGAVKTTPIGAMYAFTNTKPLDTQYRCMAQILYEKLVHRKDDNKWVIEVPAEQTLKTQKSFKHLVMEEMNISEKLEPPTKKMNPLDYVE